MTSLKIQRQALDYLANNGALITTQRKKIVQKAFTPPSHYTAEELLARSRKADPTISRATVYRTLALLVHSGLLHELTLKKNTPTKHYDFNYLTSPEHNHIICTDCGKIYEFDDPSLSARRNALLRKLGFKPKTIQLRIEATCPHCLTAKKTKH